MKKFRIEYIVFILSLTVFACDDYLTTDSPSAYTEANLFINIDYAQKAVNSMYAINASMEDCFWYDIDSDIEFNIEPNNTTSYSIAHYDHNAGTSFHKLVWGNYYKGIELANISIKNLPQSKIWEGENSATAKYLYGQAVTMRAYFYYRLMIIWGDVPFVTEPVQGNDNFYVPKTERDSIYEYLIQDLKDVEDYVPWMSTTNTAEEVNKGFVKGLRARMALAYAGYSLRNVTFETRRGRYWEEYYGIARQECKEIMESGQHSLNPSYENVFKTFHAYKQDNTYRESFAEIAYGRGMSGRVGYAWGMRFVKNDPQYGFSAPQFYTSPTYYYGFDRADTRRNVNAELYDYYSASNLGKQVLQQDWYNFYGWGLCKWRKSWIEPPMGGNEKALFQTGINFPLMRYSDVILMFAESENELNGPTEEAKEALSLIRKRAFEEEVWDEKVTRYVDSVATSKEDFFNAIVDERMWEFGGELIRKWDLTRWKLIGPKIRELRENMSKMVNNDPKYANVPDYVFWKRNDDGETIDILNPDYRITESSIEGYTRARWMGAMTSYYKDRALNVVFPRIANGYDESVNNHLYPISTSVINESNGVLSNDQIPGW